MITRRKVVIKNASATKETEKEKGVKNVSHKTKNPSSKRRSKLRK